VSLAVLLATTAFLKKFWYDRLERGEGLAKGAGETAHLTPPQIAEMAHD
jgi:hypothetical protein